MSTPKRYIRHGFIGGDPVWFLFDAGASRGIVACEWATLRSIASRHARAPLPEWYGWADLPDGVRS